MPLTLVRPELQYVPSFCSFVEEMRAAGEKIWEVATKSPNESEAEFASRLMKAEVTPPPGLVPESHYWGWDGKEIVGRIALRHVLNDNLRAFGGHIGYEVRPSARRRGVATAMLRLLLLEPQASKIGSLLLTCAPTNEASIKTILRNGGVFDRMEYVEKSDRDTNYYWIELAE